MQCIILIWRSEQPKCELRISRQIQFQFHLGKLPWNWNLLGEESTKYNQLFLLCQDSFLAIDIFFYSDIKYKNRFDLNNEYRYTLTFKVHYFCQLQISLNPLTIPTVSFLFHSILNNSSNSPEKVRPACKIQLVIISSKLNNYKPRTKTRRFSHNLGT